MACSPDINSYHCTGDSFRESIDKADYIIVTKLEEYLPENKGRFKVLMALRGDIPVGATVKHKAEPVTHQSEADGGGSCSQAIPLGELIVFMGKTYKREKMDYVPKEFECSGKVYLNDEQDTGYETLHGITNLILKSNKAKWVNGGPEIKEAF